MFTDPNYFFNSTNLSPINETLATVINGNLTPGHFQVVAEVAGMDILIALVIVQTMGIVFLLIYTIMGRNLHSRRWKK